MLIPLLLYSSKARNRNFQQNAPPAMYSTQVNKLQQQSNFQKPEAIPIQQTGVHEKQVVLS